MMIILASLSMCEIPALVLVLAIGTDRRYSFTFNSHQHQHAKPFTLLLFSREALYMTMMSDHTYLFASS